MQSNLADLMMHDLGTADLHYDVARSMNRSIIASEYMRKCVFNINDESESDIAEESDDEGDSKSNIHHERYVIK